MNESTTNVMTYDVLILAGGRSSRFDGEDKGLQTLNGNTLIEHCINRVNKITRHIMISANRNLDIYHQYGYTIVTDNDGNFNGPLAGIYASLPHIKSNYIFVCPCDMPFLPADIENQLAQAILETSRPICVLKHHNRLEHLVVLIERNQLDSIPSYLEAGGRSVIGWLEQQAFATYESNADAINFLNINNQNDLAIASKVLSKQKHRMLASLTYF